MTLGTTLVLSSCKSISYTNQQIKDYCLIGNYLIETENYREMINKMDEKDPSQKLTMERWQAFAKAYDSNKDFIVSNEEFQDALTDTRLK